MRILQITTYDVVSRFPLEEGRSGWCIRLQTQADRFPVLPPGGVSEIGPLVWPHIRSPRPDLNN